MVIIHGYKRSIDILDAANILLIHLLFSSRAQSICRFFYNGKCIGEHGCFENHIHVNWLLKVCVYYKYEKLKKNLWQTWGRQKCIIYSLIMLPTFLFQVWNVVHASLFKPHHFVANCNPPTYYIQQTELIYYLRIHLSLINMPCGVKVVMVFYLSLALSFCWKNILADNSRESSNLLGCSI